MIDYLEIGTFMAAAECDTLRAELRAASGAPAPLLGGEVRPQVRRATRIAVDPGGIAPLLKALFAYITPALQRRFGLTLTHFEEPQFLRYETGDYFVAHQDGNTPLIHDDSRFRKVSAVLFLSRQSAKPAPDTYGGGEFVLHGPYSGPQIRVPLAPRPGALIAFRAETTHEVRPVTHGERFTVVTWYR